MTSNNEDSRPSGGPLQQSLGAAKPRTPGRQVPKTNAARFLDSLGISYELREYAVDPEEFSAIIVAEKVGLPPEQVFKTLVCTTSDREHIFAIVPGPDELDFKKLARACGARKAEMASLKQVEPLTGYVRGGVTIFGARKDFPAYIDETIELIDLISVSAGTRGIQILLSPVNYLRAANARANGATIAPLTKDFPTPVRS
jgi:Cys-tRNA(Pro)/Cys-tRNA(Cys) deacylase